MASLAIPSFYSAKIIALPHPAATHTEVNPWRGILAVEPDPAVLSAKSLLLASANYCVTQATGEGDLFPLQGKSAFALAILSDRLGKRLLGAVAQIVRRQWPRTRILILGKVAPSLEDHLYDEQLDRSSDPQQVIEELENLYQGIWNQQSKTLDWNAAASLRYRARKPISESDPTKIIQYAPTDERSLRNRPSGIRLSTLQSS